jgi:hypothetical protein
VSNLYIKLSLIDDAKLYVLQHKNRMFCVKHSYRGEILTMWSAWITCQNIDIVMLMCVFLARINFSKKHHLKHVLQHIFKLKSF